MLPLRHLLYSERDVFLLPDWSSKQTNRTIEQQISSLSLDIIFLLWWSSVCLAFTVKIKWKEPAEIHPDRYNSLPSPGTAFFFSFSGSSLRIKTVILETHWCCFGLFLCIYFIVNISDCFPQSCSAVGFLFLLLLLLLFCLNLEIANIKTDICVHPDTAAQGWLWCAADMPACPRVNSNSNSSVLLSSVCSRCCTGCQIRSLLLKKNIFLCL